MISTAMLLAAGYGKRMKPLTDYTAKPLLPIHGQPLIARHIEALAKAGVRHIVINVCPFPEHFVQQLGHGEKWNVKIQYSVESQEEHPLETAGGIIRALPLLGNDPFILISADIVTDFAFEKLTALNPSAAHLVLVDNPPHHPEGDYALRDGRLFLEGEPKLNYAGIGVYHPHLFRTYPPGVLKLGTVLKDAIPTKTVTGEYYKGAWFNLGTIEQLEACRLALDTAATSDGG